MGQSYGSAVYGIAEALAEESGVFAKSNELAQEIVTRTAEDNQNETDYKSLIAAEAAARNAAIAAVAETKATILAKLGAIRLVGDNTGDQVIPTALPASDVYSWAKQPNKPGYDISEITNVPNVLNNGIGSYSFMWGLAGSPTINNLYSGDDIDTNSSGYQGGGATSSVIIGGTYKLISYRSYQETKNSVAYPMFDGLFQRIA